MIRLLALWDPRTLGLSRAVWRVEAGCLLNAVGTGFVLPFTVIYLHDIRGFSLGIAGVIVALIGAAGVVTVLFAGTWSDRLSSRSVLIVALVMTAAGYVLFGFAHVVWDAMLAAILVGAGEGLYYTSHYGVLGALTFSSSLPAAFSLERTATNLGFGIGGVLGGLIASRSSPASFELLFFINAASCLAFIAILPPVPADDTHDRQANQAGSYREALHDGSLLWVLAINVVLVTAGYGLLRELTPVYAEGAAHVSSQAIGGVFLLNTWLVVVLQIPTVRIVTPSRRTALIAATGVLWAASLLLVLLAGTTLTQTLATVVIAIAFTLFTVGQCLQASTLAPLVAELAPLSLRPRYLALFSLTWQLALTVGPAFGGYAIGHSPIGLWAGAAAACLLAAAAAPLLGKTLSMREQQPAAQQP